MRPIEKLNESLVLRQRTQWRFCRWVFVYHFSFRRKELCTGEAAAKRSLEVLGLWGLGREPQF